MDRFYCNKVYNLFLLWMCFVKSALPSNYHVTTVNLDKCLPSDTMAGHINHMEMDTVDGYVYVGSVNCLMQLNESLSALHYQLLGPHRDSPYCHSSQGEDECCSVLPCSPGQGRQMEDSSVKSILLNYPRKELLVCTNLFLGACRKFARADLAPKPSVQDSESYIVPFDRERQAQMLMLSNDQIFVATSRPIYTDSLFYNYVPSLAVRNYDNLNLVDRSSVSVKSKLQIQRQDFEIFYQKIFKSKSFVYTLSVQPQKGSTNSQGPYVTHISRICEDDSTFLSYVEMPLECSSPATPNTPSTNYNILLAAETVKPGKRLRESLEILSEEVVLVTAFASAKNSHSADTNNDSVICLYTMKDVRRAFTRAIQKCYNGTEHTETGPAHFKPGYQCRKIDSVTIDDSFCNHDANRNNPIAGTEPIVQEPNLYLESDVKVTGLKSTVLDDSSTVVFAGTDHGEIIKIVVDSKNSSYAYERVLVKAGDAINRDMIMDRQKENLIVATRQAIHKLPVQNCGQYTTCSSCQQAHDPYCGWCTLASRCTLKTDNACPNHNKPLHWLSYTQDECPSIAYINPSDLDVSKTSTIRNTHDKKIKLSLLVLNLPLPLSGRYKCAFTYNNITKLKDATRLDGPEAVNSTIECDTPTYPELPVLPANSDHAELNLSIQLGDKNFVTKKLQIFDCSIHSNCTSCTESMFPCTWCARRHECVKDSSSCTNDFLVTGRNVPGNSDTPGPEMCPQMIADKLDLMVPASKRRSISFHVSNLQEFQKDLTCHFNLPGKGWSYVVGRLSGENEDNVTCDSVEFDYSTAEKFVSVPVRLSWGPNREDILDNPNNTQVKVYKCKQVALSCGACLTADETYGCGWCDSSSSGLDECSVKEDCLSPHQWLARDQTCNSPGITKFVPLTGPKMGGTKVNIDGVNLGKVVEDVKDHVTVAGMKCHVIDQGYQPASRILCETRSINANADDEPVCGPVIVNVNGIYSDVSSHEFCYVTPRITDFHPKVGPAAGSTNLTIYGQNLAAGTWTRVSLESTEITRYNGRRMYRAVQEELTCVIKGNTKTDEQIECKTPSAPSSPSTWRIVLRLDNAEFKFTDHLFQYKMNPTVKGLSPPGGIMSGGTTVTVTGTNLNITQMPRLLVYLDNNRFESPCDAERATGDKLVCTSPKITGLDNSRSRDLHFGLLMDGVKELLDVTSDQPHLTYRVYTDPVIKKFQNDEKTIQPDQYLTVDWLNLEGGLGEGDLVVTVGKYECNVTTLPTGNPLSCKLPQDMPLPFKGTVLVQLGRNKNVTVGTLKYGSDMEGATLTPVHVGIITGVIGVLIIVAIFITVAYIRKSKEKERMQKRLENQMDALESRVARECKEAFAELQTDMTVFQDNLCGLGLPFRNYRSFTMKILFPTQNEFEHPVTRELNVPARQKEQFDKGLKLFNQLIANKTFVLLFIRTMEQNPNFSTRELVGVASLLSVALQDRMEYHTDILKTLLAELIEKQVANKRSPLLLFRRTESVAERMLSNWLAFLLHRFLLDSAGQPLFMLFRAIKQQVDRGPVDIVGGEARYSLNEDKLIRQTVDFKILHLRLPDQSLQFNNAETVKALDCDTISQVKEKILDSMYKNMPASRRPDKDELDLEYRPTNAAPQILRDDDSTSQMDGEYKKLNTLAHYQVCDNAVVALIQKYNSVQNMSTMSSSGSQHLLTANNHKDSPNMSRSVTPHTITGLDTLESQGIQYFHLVKPSEWDSHQETMERSNKMVSEVYLTRLLATKMALQKYIDDLLRTIFSTAQDNLFPFAIKYMFDFLDDQALHHGCHEPDVVHTWKSNSLPLRFWVNVIKNPEFVFDVHKSEIVHSCLAVVAGAFMDSCSISENKLSKDSPSSKLLFAKEIPVYKKMVEKYYHDIKSMPAISDQDMNAMLAAESRNHGKDFQLNSALYELYQCVQRHFNPLMHMLEDDEFARSYKLAAKLRAVEDLMR